MPKKKETRGRPKTLTKRQATKNHTAASTRWNSNNTKIINMRFNLNTDQDVIEKLDSVPNKTNYVRQLVREDIKNNN